MFLLTDNNIKSVKKPTLDYQYIQSGYVLSSAMFIFAENLIGELSSNSNQICYNIHFPL